MTGTIRSSMGFSHPNVFGAFILSISAEYLYLREKKLNIFDITLIGVLSFLVGYYADSRTPQLSIILILIISIIIKNINLDKIKIGKIIPNMFFICAILSFISGSLYANGNSLMIKLNEIFTGRINFIAKFFEKYPINLFGNKIEIIGTKLSSETGVKPWILDNAYALILLRYGIIAFFMMGIYLNIFFKKAWKNKEYMIVACMLVFLIFGLLESGIIKIAYNIFWLYFAELLYGERKEE